MCLRLMACSASLQPFFVMVKQAVDQWADRQDNSTTAHHIDAGAPQEGQDLVPMHPPEWGIQDYTFHRSCDEKCISGTRAALNSRA